VCSCKTFRSGEHRMQLLNFCCRKELEGSCWRPGRYKMKLVTPAASSEWSKVLPPQFIGVLVYSCVHGALSCSPVSPIFLQGKAWWSSLSPNGDTLPPPSHDLPSHSHGRCKEVIIKAEPWLASLAKGRAGPVSMWRCSCQNTI
jgi:hypothetical protein